MHEPEETRREKDTWTTPRVESLDIAETRNAPGIGLDGFFFFLSAS